MRARAGSAFLWFLLLAACSGGDVPSASEATVSSDWWVPVPGTTWQWQLSGAIDTSLDVDMFDIDLFDAPDTVFQEVHAAGRIVVCYFSAGSVEDWRQDSTRFPPEVVGEPLDEWPGERWLDIRRGDVILPILEDRLDVAVERGCDAVEPDNVDGFSNPTGFALTGADQLRFNRALAALAHERGLSIGLKNDLDQISDLVGSFDWLLVEQCVEFDECHLVEPFIEAGKAVFVAEYGPADDAACVIADRWQLSLIFKDLDLGPEFATCG